MNDEKMMDGLRTVVSSVNTILMFITVVLQLQEVEVIRHIILCCCILLLLTVTLVLDGILKDGKEMALHGILYALWFFNIIIHLLQF